jgi:dTDP-4-amino-4,6-dideoxygalactose transaminase
MPTLFGALVWCWQYLGRDPDRLINSLTRGFAAGDILTHIRYRPPTRLLQLLQHRLQSVDEDHFQRRQAAAIQFISQLEDQAMRPGQSARQNSFWLVPLLMPDSQLAIQAIRQVGFDATNITTSLKSFGETSSQAQQLIEHVVYLQIDPNWSEEEYQQLAEVINSFSTQEIKQLTSELIQNI